MKRLVAILPTILLVAACAGGLPQPTGTGGAPTNQPTGALPTPANTPGQGTVDPCALITAAELTTIMGTEMVEQPAEESGTCTFTATGGIPGINIRFESGDLSTPRMLFGDSSSDVTIAGQPAVIGNLFGVIVYVQHGQQMLVIQSVLTEDTPAVRTQVTQIAETAYSRIP